MKDQSNGVHSPGVFATLQRAWVAGREVARESVKPKPVTLEAYLLPQHMHHNHGEIQAGESCGCICCEQIYPRTEIKNWVSGGMTAVCPRCNTASVIGAGAGFLLTPQLLHQAHQMLFQGRGRRA